LLTGARKETVFSRPYCKRTYTHLGLRVP